MIVMNDDKWTNYQVTVEIKERGQEDYPFIHAKKIHEENRSNEKLKETHMQIVTIIPRE